MKRARRFSIGPLRFVYRSNSLGRARLGLAVSRKCGCAVRRNRIKRILREIFRHHSFRSNSLDLLVIPLHDDFSDDAIVDAMQSALSRIPSMIHS